MSTVVAPREIDPPRDVGVPTPAPFDPPDHAERDVAGRARGWMHPVHSGEGFGVLGETAAVVGALAAAVLVWTGLALALRRLRRRLARGGASAAAA